MGMTMNGLMTTVVAKTDICGFTSTISELSRDELSALLLQHKDFITDIAIKHQGMIIKGEGDSFWMTFPSVTTAAIAAFETQQELRILQSGKADDSRIAIRIAITLGDVLHQDNDIFGDSVNLAARIEAITPPDEIYLSQAAWLALNTAEMQTSFVNEFKLKGISEPAKIYKIEQRHRTRIIEGQIILCTDLGAFGKYQQTHTIEDTEKLLLFLDDSMKETCRRNHGVVRNIVGDSYIVTFATVTDALTTAEELFSAWEAHTGTNDIQCGLNIGIHKGDVYVFRSYFFGWDVNVAGALEGMSKERERGAILCSERIRDALMDTPWKGRTRLEGEIKIRNSTESLNVYRLNRVDMPKVRY